MTTKEKQDKLENLRAAAKDAQAELGYIALQREAQNARWKALKAQLAAGEAEYRKVAETVAEDPAE
jgi:hypothetical protein